MTLTELRYIVALAKTKHFGQAAKLCHVSQPTLSVAINKLEGSLKVAIFERQHSDVRITSAGERIIAQAQRVLDEASKIHELATMGKSQLTTPFKIGAIYTVAPYLFPTLVPKIKKYAPQMPLIIQEDYTKNLKEKLIDGELDAIFVALPFKANGIVKKTLYDEPLVVLMRKDHPLAAKKSISNSDLSSEKIILLGEDNCLRKQIISACPSCYSAQHDEASVAGTSLETIRHMVASGLGVTIIPSTAAEMKYYGNTLCVRPFKQKIPQRTIVLAWRTSFPRCKAIDVIVQAVVDSHLNGVCVVA